MENRLVPVLHNVSLTIHRGQTCALLGSSGSGKSTLLNILGLLDPHCLAVSISTARICCALRRTNGRIRNQHIGFVFQAFNLLPRLSALENGLPLAYRGMPVAGPRTGDGALERVGLADRSPPPADLSGGQRQRVAIARALIGNPSVIRRTSPRGTWTARPPMTS